jgi:hypothetical protein
MSRRMKLPYLGLNIRLLFTDLFFGSETFISVPDWIRPKSSDPSGSGSATLLEMHYYKEDFYDLLHRCW